MNKFLLYGSLIAAMLMPSLSAFGQTGIHSFTADSVKFLEEITELFEASKARKKEGKDFMEEFTPLWYGGKFSEQNRQVIYKTCNFMLEKRMTPFPDFKNYLYSVMSFVESGQSDESFKAWQETLEKLIDGRSKRNFTNFLVFSNYFFDENALYKSASTVWKASNSDYTFGFNDEVPVIVFPSLDLRCYSKGDSAVIYHTSGTYYPTEEKWIGKGGKVNFVRAGQDENQVYVLIKNYTIGTKSSNYEMDSVMFYNTKYFNYPLIGRLTEKVLANVTEKNASYPRFESYNKRIKIENIVENVDFDGGFSQEGNKVKGAGNEQFDAYLKFYREDTLFIFAAANSFTIFDDRILADKAAVTIYLNEDSITHPGLTLKVLSEERVLKLVREDKGVSKSPYFNTFHNIDMYFETLHWNIDEPIMEFSYLTGSTDKSALFESNYLYNEYKFDRMQGMDPVHPFIKIRNCARDKGVNDLSVQEVARCMRLSVSQVKPFLMNLAIGGFLYYDFDHDYVQVKDKLHHYISAKSKREDYDVLQFRSEVRHGSNASLNLLNYDMRIQGVKMIFLSDSHNVFIYPAGREIVLKKNRDFQFSGIINAGRLEFFGKEFSFEYDNFKIDMPNVDSLRMRVLSEKTDEYGQKKLVRVKTVIQHIKGELKIDHPNNKSGLRRLAEYPVFNSLKDSYVFYDRKEIQGGAYEKDKVYFHLEPFTFDSLDNFVNEGIAFKGTFASSGIFPDFEEVLTLQPDYSLGFVKKAPDAGFPIYEGKGTYYDDINMSHKGLKGSGSLKYLTSTSTSNEFSFFPDSMNATAQSFIIEEQMQPIEYPPVTATNVRQHWRPHQDYLFVEKIKEPLIFYDGHTELHGSVMLQPTGLTGKGTVAFESAKLESEMFDFKFIEIFADTADFKLQALQEKDALSFSTNNVNAHIDFEERKGQFVSNGGGSYIDFPVNQYVAFMDKFTWFMDDEDIELSASTKTTEGAQDVALEGSKFVSTHPKQDSISFYSPAAKYDLKNNIITAKGVKFINIADAMIYPDEEVIVVEKKAKIKTLENARILANFITQYHTIYNSDVNIYTKKRYMATGDYDYIDENNRKQTINFESVGVDSTAQTYARGIISDDASFSLSPNYGFKGEVELIASKKLLNFNGYSKIFHSCDALANNWFSFKSDIDPDEIYIPIDSVVKGENNQPLSTGILMSKDSVKVYSAFLSRQHSNQDIMLLPVYGFLYYDKREKEYKVADLEKLNAPFMPGNYLSLNTDNCQVFSEGNFTFGADLGQIDLSPVGNITQNTVTGEVNMEIMILADFFFSGNALDDMAKKIEAYEGMDGVAFDRPVYEKGLQGLLGKKDADKLISDASIYGSFKRFPSELNKPLFITDVKFKWNPETTSYQSVGKIGVGNIHKNQLNRYIDGHIEIVKKRNGDTFTMYFELDKETWYFFTYQRNLMQAISSDKEFNDYIIDTKSDKRKIKARKGEAPYQYMLSTERRKRDFLRSFEKFEEED